jgi:hypothetical protein
MEQAGLFALNQSFMWGILGGVKRKGGIPPLKNPFKLNPCTGDAQGIK